MGIGSQTIGFRYYFSLHMGIGRGPLNELVEIRVGDIPAYSESFCVERQGNLIYLDKPDLFGGDEKEGGIQGLLYVYSGAEDQVLQPARTFAGKKLPSIAASLGGDVPNFRGVTTLWYNGLVAALNPYPKEWSFRVRRTTAGWYRDDPWYPSKATVNLVSESGKPIRAMNGVHIVYEINTSPEWGRGIPPEFIDENSFVEAANQLCAEGLGLCIPWFRQESIKEFLPMVVNHIGAVQYLDRGTGKITIRLIRGGYDINDLPLFTPDTGLLDLLDDDASGEDTAYNEIIVKGFDPTTKEDISIRVQNSASIQSQGEIISNTVEYRGIPTRALLARIALREMKVQLPLRRMTVILDRRGWRIAPGMVFRVSHPNRGIGSIVLRAGDITDGNPLDGKITIKALEDVFGMPETTYVTPTVSAWTPPSFVAVPPAESRLLEANWRDFYRLSTQADRDAIDVGTSLITHVAKNTSNVQTQGYRIATKADAGTYETFPGGSFTAWLTLAANILPLDTSLTVLPENRTAFELEFTDGMVALIGDEQVQIASFDALTGIAIIVRGVADTIPQSHIVSTTIWLVDDETVSDGKEYQDGEIVYAKALTKTSTDVLALDLGVENSLEMNQRIFRPYPPGNVKQGGTSTYLPRGEETEPVITWAHRDRIVEADVPIGHLAASVGPETGVTYTVRVYETGTTILLSTHAGIALATWTYTSAMQTVDGLPDNVTMELESVRDGLASYFRYRFDVAITSGWGYGWGLDWGGA